MSQYAIVCPSCNQMINKNSRRCPNCGWINNNLNWLAININKYDDRYKLIAINVFFYVASLIISLFFTIRNGLNIFSLFQPNNAVLKILGWADPATAFAINQWQLLSSTFLHGGFFHIIFNMIWLYQLYPQIEALIGRSKAYIVYFISGISGSTIACLFGSYPVVGASGAIFGLMGAFIAISRNSSNIQLKVISKRYMTFVIILLVIGFISPGVSNLSHIGGWIAGYILGFIFTRYKLPSNIQFYITASCLILTIITLLIMIWQPISILI